MNWAEIKQCDIANGPGVRTSLFVSGCRNGCPGCFNQEAQDFSYGRPFDQAAEDRIIGSCRPDFVAGLTLLGGEPMEPENQRALLPFLTRFREELPGKTVWCFTGCLWEQLRGPGRCRTEVTDRLLSLLDVLVDGPFLQAEYDLSLRFRGSRNQRLIQVPESLRQGRVVLWQDEKIYADHGM